MSKVKTKDLLLDAGWKTFLEKGYNHSGIEAILAGLRTCQKVLSTITFDSKEDFGLRGSQPVRLVRRASGMSVGPLGDISVPPLARLRQLLRPGDPKALGSDQCRKGCLVGNLSQEMADQSEVFRARLEEIFEELGRPVCRVPETGPAKRARSTRMPRCP